MSKLRVNPEVADEVLELLRNLCKEYRKFIKFEIKTVSLMTKISKEDLVNFEKGKANLPMKKLLILLNSYGITLEVILSCIELSKKDPEVEKEIKNKNKNLNNTQAEELAKLAGFSGYKK